MSIEPFIKCSDIVSSLAFYSRNLDFEIRIAPDPDPNAFMSKYALLEREKELVHLSAHAGDGVFGNVIYVRVDNIVALFEKISSKGLSKQIGTALPAITMPLTKQTWGMKEFSVKDPDGNRVTFGEQIEAE